MVGCPCFHTIQIEIILYRIKSYKFIAPENIFLRLTRGKFQLIFIFYTRTHRNDSCDR